MSALTDKIKAAYRLIRERGDDGVWLSLTSEESALQSAGVIDGNPRELPLRGWTVAVKDNIDVAGLPTTAGCPEYAYTPKKNALVVQRLIEAGALVIGKTNLDQFATGLNGTRTPHTIPRNAIHPDYISGGSSSGSAVAVAVGEVDVALGTDTAGSGRVPAAFNNLVGFKPTRGRWSTRGVVPACRTLDCVTVLSRTLAQALQIDEVVKGFDPADDYSRRELAPIRPSFRRVAVLPEGHREFFGDVEYARLYQEATRKVADLGWEIGEFDYTPLRDAANLLYSGPWIGERQAVLHEFMAKHPEAVHPVVRQILEGAPQFSARESFQAHYRLAELFRKSEEIWQSFDAILLPTAGTIPTVAQMLADPVTLNADLGRYTNFVNLLDLCAVAVPAGFRRDGLPFGVTFIGPAWSDKKQAGLAGEFLGEYLVPGFGGIKFAVVGAHLRGQPLNRQLLDLGAVFITETRTAPRYRLFALPDTTPSKPGMVRVAEGAAFEVEVWELTEAAFGRFVAAVPGPLGIGSVELESGEVVKGFLCEEIAVSGAQDISVFAGWRDYLKTRI